MRNHEATLWKGFSIKMMVSLINRRLLSYTVPLAGAFSLSYVLGAQLQNQGLLMLNVSSVIKYVVLWAIITVILSAIFVFAPKLLCHYGQVNGRRLFLVSFVGFCLIACTWMLAYFPMLTNFDINGHLAQIESQQYGTHHTLIYTLLLSALLVLPPTLAFWVLGMLQMCIIGMTLSYGLWVCNRAGVHRGLLIVTAVYLCIFPVFGYFAFSTTKDTLFACFLLLTLIELYRLGDSGRWGKARLVIFGVLMCLFRTNGLLMIGLFMLLSFFVGLRRCKPYRIYALLMACIVILGISAQQLLVLGTHAQTPNSVTNDVLSLPLQQIARVLQVSQQEEDIQKITSLFIEDSHVKVRYNRHLADPVKMVFSSDVPTMLHLWASLFFEYPLTYLEAFLELTRGLWYVDDVSHANINFWIASDGYFTITTRSEWPAYPVHAKSLVPAIATFYAYEFEDNAYQALPLIPYMFSIALQAWLVVIGLCYAAYHKKTVIMFLFGLCVLLPLFLMPCVYVRYALPLFMVNPFAFLLLSASTNPTLGQYRTVKKQRNGQVNGKISV